MQSVKQAFTRFLEYFKKQCTVGKILIASISLIVLCCLCTIPIVIFSPDDATPETAERAASDITTDPVTDPTQVPTDAPTELPTLTPTITATKLPTNTSTPKPTNTPLPPTSTPDPNFIKQGAYLVGIDIQPGIYRGEVGTDFMDSCYWNRLKDLSGSLDAIIANDNSIGQFYVQISESDYAFETACDMYRLDPLPQPPDVFPTTIDPGMYLVGIDIQSGTYKGQAGEGIMDSCYWARLSNVAGGMDGILANANANGQFYVEVRASDFALATACELERVGD